MQFFMPPVSYLGFNSIQDLAPAIVAKGFKKCLIVTDEMLLSLKLEYSLIKMLQENKIEFCFFSGVQPNPTVNNVNAGLAILQQEQCDFVISLGGGSPHDAAKAIALLATNGGCINDYEGINRSKRPQLPLISINTTAGTASEMTRFCIITDEARHIKMAIVDENVTPIIAVNDTELMLSMPKSLTAATGMDALTHAIEAYVSTQATPMTDACAEKAIELIGQYLKTAVYNGQNRQARDMMAYAEYLAGMAFNNASLGYVHAMAHQLGGYYDLPHGVCNAVLLPHVVQYNSDVAKEKIQKVGLLLGVPHAIFAQDNSTQPTIDAIKTLAREIEIPLGLSLLAVKEEDFPTLADNALLDACGLTNPKQATKDEIIAIYQSAF